MSLGDPRRRKPIRDEVSLDEIRDNVKNNAVLTRTRSKTKYKPPNFDDEESLGFERSRKVLHETFVISRSSQNFATRPKSRTQSPETKNRHSYGSDSNDDISDDEEDATNSYEICPPSDGIIAPKISPRLSSSVSEYYRQRSFNKTPVYEPESYRKSYSNNASKSTSNGIGIYFLLVLILGLISFYFVINKANLVDVATQTEANDVGSESQVLNDIRININNMKSKYKNQDRDIWLDAYASIASLINQETKKPSIIVLLGNKSNPLECLARLLGNVSSKALRSDRLVLTPKEFEADMGSVIQTMRSHLKDKKAIIVSDLLNINVEALKAFHNLCDRINPLVEEAIYIITVIADDYDDNSSPLQYIETQLHKKLSGKMKEDAIQPLITRITDGPILTVKPEPTVTDCSL